MPHPDFKHDAQWRPGSVIPVAQVQLTLPGLADEINAAHAEAVQAARSSIEAIVRCGEKLIEAKDRLGHGEWIPWVEKHLDFGRRQASSYMRVARQQEQMGSSASHIDSLRSCVSLLSDERPHVANNSGDNEWYTPSEYIQAALDVMGSIDLDPASSEEANLVVGASQIYTIEDNGLERDWFGNVWMNPPYAQPAISDFASKLVEQAGNIKSGCVLVNNATETKWFAEMLGVSSAVCFPTGRVRFWQPGSDDAAPLQGQAVLYVGRAVKRFSKRFGQLGAVLHV